MLKRLTGFLFFIAMLAAAAVHAETTPTEDVRGSVEAVIASSNNLISNNVFERTPATYGEGRYGTKPQYPYPGRAHVPRVRPTVKFGTESLKRANIITSNLGLM